MIRLTADYHTHTPYSHGKNTVLENVESARAHGLSAVGISDHGFSHLAFALRREKVPALIAECRAAEEATGVNVLVGIESNLRGVSGLCDLTERDFENFDLYLMGMHVVIRYEKWSDMRLGWGGWLRDKLHTKPSARAVREATRAYCNAIEKNPVDIVTHLNYRTCADAVEVAKCCRDYGTYLELSAKKVHLTDEELAAVAATGVRFVIGSDAHTADRVGDCALAAEQIERVGIPLGQIDNLGGRLPAFRFAEYKKRM